MTQTIAGEEPAGTSTVPTATADVKSDDGPPRPRFRPPFPARPIGNPSALRLITEGRRNLLSVWPEHTYASGSFSFSILKRRIHVVSTPDVVREVFVDKADAVADKSWQQRHALRPLAGSGLIISDGALWRTRRPKVAGVTHTSNMPLLSQAMVAAATDLARVWGERGPGFEIDIVAEMAQLAARIVTSAMFQREVDPLVVARIVDAFDVYRASVKQIDGLFPFTSFDWLPRFVGLRAARAARAIRRDLDRLIDMAVADAGERAPFLRPFLAAGPNGTPILDRQACRDEAAVMLLAGHETTAITMAWAFFLLSQDFVAERRLQDEVDRVIEGEAAEFAMLPELPFTRAVVQETLRLYPPVPLLARRAVRDFRIGLKEVAAGDTVLLNAWILHRHQRYWEEPDAFVPERFMPGEHKAPVRYAYAPFGTGPRVCTGATFGQTEAIICIATLARHFRLRLRPGTTVEPVCRLSLRPGRMLPMIVERRRP